MSQVLSMADARENRTPPGTKVYSCGKCQEQGVKLFHHHIIMCGRESPEPCDARMAADWYEPTDATSRSKHPRPRSLVQGGIQRFCCSVCLFPFFHMQADGSLTCYRERCKRTALFRWRWHADLSKAKANRGVT